MHHDINQQNPKSLRAWFFSMKFYGILLINFFLSLLGYMITYRVIPKFTDMFIDANLFGIDLGKGNKKKM